MIAITFALPEESRDFVHALGHPGAAGSVALPALLGNLGSRELWVFHTGMGAARTCERLGRFLSEHPVRQVISAGYAGGLDPALPAGALFLGENYCDPCLLAAAQALFKGRAWTGRLATSPAVLETVRQKADFACRTGAIAADMETAAIAAICQERAVPLLSLRVISDTAREELPVPFSVCFDAERERPRPLALTSFLLRHPSRLRGFIRFASTIGQARRRLAQALVEMVTMQDQAALSTGASSFTK